MIIILNTNVWIALSGVLPYYLWLYSTFEIKKDVVLTYSKTILSPNCEHSCQPIKIQVNKCRLC